MHRSLSCLALALALAGCASAEEKKTTFVAPPVPAAAEEEPGEAPSVEPQEEVETFGDPLGTKSPVVSLADLLAKAEAFEGKTIRTSGVVRAVCTKRGCWMEVRPEEVREGATMRVKFFGYAFFMPKDSRGAKLTIEGKAHVTRYTADEVAYLEGEGATFDEKNADGSVDLVTFTATGVEMRGRNK